MKIEMNKNSITTSIIDLVIINSLAIANSGNLLLEIGVYKGGFVTNFLRNVPLYSVVGVDPFPNNLNAKAILLKNITSMNLDDRFKLYENYNSIPDKNSFNIIHIDGEHSEESTYLDLVYSFQNLKIGGFIAVDDIWYPTFPGVASAVFKFLHTSDIAPFLITRQKIYMCHTSSYLKYYELTKEILKDNRLRYASENRMGRHDVFYPQSISLNGFEPLIVLTERPPIFLLFKLGQYFYILRRVLKSLLPPALDAGIKRFI